MAAVGFVGVIVGGVLNWLAQAALTRRGERASARAAARLVHAEARGNWLVLKNVLADRDWRRVQAFPLTSEDWRAHRAILANHLSDHEWAKVVHSYELVQLYENRAGSTSWDADEDTVVGNAMRLIEEAATVLKVAGLRSWRARRSLRRGVPEAWKAFEIRP